MKVKTLAIAAIALFGFAALEAGPASAQQFPIGGPAPIVQIGWSPQAGPICTGPLGVAPCADIQAWLARGAPMPPMGPMPMGPMGPMPMGPMGPMPMGPMPGPMVNAPQQGGQPGVMDALGNAAWQYGAAQAGAGAAAAASGFGVPAPAAAWIGDRVNGNVLAAQRETTVLNQGVRATTGISIEDQQKYGWKGGPNSFANQVCGVFHC
jgi:hypothetical protein